MRNLKFKINNSMPQIIDDGSSDDSVLFQSFENEEMEGKEVDALSLGAEQFENSDISSESDNLSEEQDNVPVLDQSIMDALQSIAADKKQEQSSLEKRKESFSTAASSDLNRRSSFKGMGEVNTQIKPCSTFAEQESRCTELAKKDQCINCYVFGAEAKIAPKEEPRKATKEEKLNLKLALQR